MKINEVNRKKILLSAGVPISFLNAIDSLENYGDLKYMIKKPSSSYFYLPTIHKNYNCIKNYDITPVFDGSNGDTFYVYLSNTKTSKFVHFELEQDEIYDDYGSNFMYMLADLLIDYYEFVEYYNINKLIKFGKSLGFSKSSILFKSLIEADKQNLRTTFKKDNEWKKENIPKIIEE